jgi:hypothetical protein
MMRLCQPLLIGCLALMLSGTGCVTVPTAPTAPEMRLEAYQRLQADQTLRQNTVRYWQVDGVLDLDMPDNGRRNRVTLMGEDAQRARLVVYGPFQQSAFEILVADGKIHLVDIGKRKVVEVPANARGMAQLTGIRLDPTRLFQMILGQIDPLRNPPATFTVLTDIETTTGETLRLDPASGRILERSGSTGPKTGYEAIYHWGPPTQQPVMPKRVHVTLGDNMRMELILKEWFFPKDAHALSLNLSTMEQGFAVVRPLEARPVTEDPS